MLRIKSSILGKYCLCVLMLGFGIVHADDFKMGFVNTVKLVDRAPQGKAALAAIKTEFASREDELTVMNENIKKLEDDIRTNSLVMSEQQRVEKQRNLRELQRKFQREKTEYREDINLRRNEELGKLQRIIGEAVDAIAREQGYDLIVEQAVFVGPGIDITDKVLDRLAVNN